MGIFSKNKQQGQASSNGRSTPSNNDNFGERPETYPDDDAAGPAVKKSARTGLFGLNKKNNSSADGLQSNADGPPAGNRGLPFRLGRKESDSTNAPPVPIMPAQRRQQTGPSVRDVIGRFCGLPDEDWHWALELADTLSRSEAASKEAVETLRQEFKHGIPQAQERAARLMVVLMRNTTDRFKLKIADKKFLKTLEEVFKSPKTEPRVKAMIYKAVALLAYESRNDTDLQPLVALYINIKPVDAPVDGIPIEEDDQTFNPITMNQNRSRTSRNVQANFDPKHQLQMLTQRISVAKAEAGMLNESLGYTSPETLGSNEIVQEFYPKVLAWQDFVVEQIPWAQAEADRSHRERDSNEEAGQGQTPEEKVLDELLAAHGEIQDALAVYHRLEQELQRRQQEESDLALAQERSKAETHFDRQAHADAESANPEDLSFEQIYLSAPTEAVPVASGPGRNSPVQHEVEPQKQDDFFDSTFSVPQQSPDDVPSSPSRNLGSKNPYARLSLETSPPPANPVLAGYLVDEPADEAPPSPLNPFKSSQSKLRQPSEEIPVPTQPSAKALGKIRRVSGFQTDVEEKQRQLEEQLRSLL